MSKPCNHYLKEVDNAGAIGVFKCIRCGETIVGGEKDVAEYRRASKFQTLSHVVIRNALMKMAVLFLVILVVGGILAYLAFKGSDWLLILFSLAFIGAAVLVMVYVRRAVVRGELPGRFGGTTFRHASPFNFWFQIGLYVVFAGFWLFAGLALLGLAPHCF
jgi:hypothetical protein